MRLSEYCSRAGASMELAPARTVALMLAPSLLVSTTGLFPFSPVAAGAVDEPVAVAMDEPVALLAGVGHPGAQHSAHPAAAGVASLLGRGPALFLSEDVLLGGYSLSNDGLLLATSSRLPLLLATSSRLSLLRVSSLQASHILFSNPFMRHSRRCLRRQSSVVPFAASLSIPSLVSRRAVCSFSILHQTSFILSLSRSIVPVHLASLSLEAGDLPLPSGVRDLLLLLGSTN